MKSIKILCMAMGLASIAINAYAVDGVTPKWLRNTAISPDGKEIAFTYKGDIFITPLGGGVARQLTSGSAYDSAPLWSPDSKTIVFASSREGGMDLYAIPAQGGEVRRLTTASGEETPLTFIDDDTIIYSTSELASSKSSRHPTRLTRTYSVNVKEPNARPHLYLSMPMGAADMSSDGTLIFHDKKGLENIYRKHERSSGTSDIWTYKDGKFNKLTNFNGHDLNPVWTGANEYCFVSEEDGTLNVYKVSDGKRTQLTDFKQHPVRSLSAADNGTLAFSWDGEIYTLIPGQKPQKVNVEILADQYVNDAVKYYANGNASSMAVSPDGKEVAFVLRGEVYVTDVKYKTTRRITDTPAQERMVSFSPDGKTLVYDSDRDGQWQLFTAKIKNPAEKRFAYATEIVEEPLYKGKGVAQQPSFSPDGKKVAFLEDRTTLKVIDLKTKKVNTALDGKFNYSYTDGDVPFEWSPDSEWLLVTYIGEGGWNNSDIAAVKADGSQVVDLTESGYSDGNAKWALGGKAVTYETGRYGMKSHGSWGNQWDVVLMALDAEAWDDLNATEEEIALKEEAEKEQKEKSEKNDKDKKDKKKDKKGKDKEVEKAAKKLDLDFDNRRHRMVRLTPRSGSVGDYFLSPKGDKLYYSSSATEGGGNLYERNLRTGETKLLVKGVNGGMEADAKGENLFVIGGGGIKKVDLAKGSAEPVEFEAAYDRSKAGEREYIYEHMLRQVEDKFYDKNLHGVDWKYYGDHYREFLPHISNGDDFAILLSEILGELNASHTGSKYYGTSPKFSIASLGAFFDDGYEGDGLKVEEVVSGSPLANKKANILPGDIILSIDGEKIVSGKDYYPMLEGKAGRKTLLAVKRKSGKNDTIAIKPLSAGAMSDLLYKRWVERNEKYVDSISGGKIAYVHVEGMNSPSFSNVYDRLLGKYRNADAVVVDTRWNGGGWLHNDLALLLSGKRYVDFVPRGQYIGSEPFSQWTKPSVMLVNEGNYSDAHGSPFTYQALKLGKVVGAPIPGTMTAVWWETQIDPNLIFGIPQVTSIDMQGNVLENHQLNPEIVVYNSPADELAGKDAQLEAAVKALMK